jgi:hypothetical protein
MLGLPAPYRTPGQICLTKLSLSGTNAYRTLTFLLRAALFILLRLNYRIIYLY